METYQNNGNKMYQNQYILLYVCNKHNEKNILFVLGKQNATCVHCIVSIMH